MPEQAKTSPVGPNKPATTNLSSGVRGTTPAGTSDERSAAHAVRQMFDEIAPRYDFLNHVLSMNVDRLWWRRTARSFSHILSRSDARVLDLCAGTGDMSVAMRCCRVATEEQRRDLGARFLPPDAAARVDQIQCKKHPASRG